MDHAFDDELLALAKNMAERSQHYEAVMADERRRLARAARNRQRIEPAPADKVPDDVRAAVDAERHRARLVIATCEIAALHCKAINAPEMAARFIAEGTAVEDARDELQRLRVEASDAAGELHTSHPVGDVVPAMRVDLAGEMRKRAATRED